MKIQLLPALLFAFTVTSAQAHAAPPLLVTVDRPISTDVPKVPHSESESASNPRDPKNILATSFAMENGELVTVVYYTKDGGRTWKRALFPTADRVHARNTWDPEVVFGPDGTGYDIYETQELGFWVTSTRDGGATWSKPILHRTIFGYDRSYATVAQGRWMGRLIVSGAVSLAIGARACGQVITRTSDDRGVTFAEARSYTIDDSVGCGMSPMPMESRSDGAIFTFAYGLKSGWGDGAYYISPSFDGGFTFQPLYKIVAYHQSGGKISSEEVMRKKLYEKLIFDPAIAGTALDTSNGPYRNRLYLAYPEWTGKRFVIKAVHSTADWRHWSAPVTVNSDATKGNDAIPQVAVNRDGVVAVIWTDRRNSPDNQCYQLGAALSYDGGETFSANYVHPHLTCAANPKNRAYGLLHICGGAPCYGYKLALLMEPSTSGKWSNGGDTQGFAANADGTFGAVWSNGQSGVQQLWYTAFRPSGAVIARNLSQPLVKMGHSKYPLAPVSANLDDGVRLLYTAGYDRATHTFTVNMRLKNVFPTALRGPFLLTQAKGKNFNPKIDLPIESDSGAGLAQKQAFWKFFASGTGGVLQPGQTTEQRTLRWKIRENQRTPSLSFDVTSAQ